MMVSGRRGLASAAALALVAGAAVPLAAQIDYRNLDDDRPTRVEDAYPAERYAFEFLLPYRFERERGGGSVHASVPELAYGIVRNAHVGVKAPLAAVREGGATEWGLSGLRLFALYNFNTESLWLPGLSLRTDLSVPVGSLGDRHARVTVKGIATRSWGRSRLHVNAAYSLGPDGAPAVVEPADRWWYGAALDRTLFRRSVLVVGEVYAARPAGGVPVQVNAAAGLRYQWRPTVVLDLGVARGLRRGLGPEFAVTFGVSSAFAIAGLIPGAG